MVDNLTPQEPGIVPEGTSGDASGEKQGFMSTTLGKVVVIGGAAFAFLVIAGLVVFAVITFVFVDTVNEAGDAIITGIEQDAAGDVSSTETTMAAVEPDAVPLSSIFTFRDIFDPLMKPEPAEEDTGTAGPDGEGVVTEPDTLYLQDIVVDNGVSMAVLWYNSTAYTLPAGGVIPETPWQVLSVGADSVVMLYGDTQVTLVIGQGVASK